MPKSAVHHNIDSLVNCEYTRKYSMLWFIVKYTVSVIEGACATRKMVQGTADNSSFLLAVLVFK